MCLGNGKSTVVVEGTDQQNYTSYTPTQTHRKLIGYATNTHIVHRIQSSANRMLNPMADSVWQSSGALCK